MSPLDLAGGHIGRSRTGACLHLSWPLTLIYISLLEPDQDCTSQWSIFLFSFDLRLYSLVRDDRVVQALANAIAFLKIKSVVCSLRCLSVKNDNNVQLERDI